MNVPDPVMSQWMMQRCRAIVEHILIIVRLCWARTVRAFVGSEHVLQVLGCLNMFSRCSSSTETDYHRCHGSNFNMFQPHIHMMREIRGTSTLHSDFG